jgi:hypothetical protein
VLAHEKLKQCHRRKFVAGRLLDRQLKNDSQRPSFSDTWLRVALVFNIATAGPCPRQSVDSALFG